MSADKAEITQRLRNWVHAVDAVPASDLMDEAACEIELLREAIRRYADQDATLSVCDGNVTIDITNEFVEAFGQPVAPLMPFPPHPLALTDEERQAIREAADAYALNNDDADCERIERVLRGLLDRLSPIATGDNDRPEAIATGDYPEPDNAPKQDSDPVAWIAVFDGYDADAEFVWPDRGRAEEWAASRPRVEIAPLYLQPQLTLTDAEREAIATAATCCEGIGFDSLPATLRGLLERLK